ncbi:MAG: TIGR02302 family protein [Rhodomicrobium sp.]
MMQRKGETGDAGPKEMAEALTPEERLIEGKVRAANRTLLFEKLWPRVWLPLSVAGIFILLSVFEVWQLLPPRIHFGLLCAFAAAFVLSFLPLYFSRRPTREASIARLERASALDHRPLTAFNDTLLQADPSPETLALWEAHRAHAAQALKDLTAGAPHPRIDKYDPFALRAALLLLLAAAGSWGWGDLRSRVQAAFTIPEIPAGAGFRIDAWISPPAYTRKEPFVLPAGPAARGAAAVPLGSVLTVKINGPDAAGYSVELNDGTRTQTLEPAGQSSGTYAEFSQKIERSQTLSIRRSFGAERSWSLQAIPDLPPKIAFDGPVEVSPRGVMLFKYKVEDDYGVVSAEARIERILPQAGKDGSAATASTQSLAQIGKPPVFPLSLPRQPVIAAEAKTYRDLTAHPWAGLPVVITLAAKDEAGHEALSTARGLILPERTFTKPLAKAIAGQRRSLVEDPAGALQIASNLNALSISAADDGIAPEIYLNLRSAYRRLLEPLQAEDVEAIANQLWDVALRIEDGNLSAAERELRAAQERLKDALERGAPQEEIQKLMSELRQALNRYLQALVQQKSQKSGRTASQDAKTVTPQELQQLLDKIENLAKAGSPEAAAQMLNQLRDILESVQAGNQGSKDSERENAEKLQQLDRLTDVMRQEQKLLDKTFRAQQGGDSGQADAGRGGESGGQQQGRGQGQGRDSGLAGLKERQEDVQKQLQDLLSGMKPGKDGNAVQRKLKEADSAMGDAAGALDQSELGEASDQEGRALEALRQGARSIAEQMMQAARQGNGPGQANRDPLGRKQGNQLTDPGDSVKVPDEITVQQARRILDELRKRLGEPSRPALELDYLERLIKP